MLAALVPAKAPITVMCLDASRLVIPTEIPAGIGPGPVSFHRRKACTRKRLRDQALAPSIGHARSLTRSFGRAGMSRLSNALPGAALPRERDDDGMRTTRIEACDGNTDPGARQALARVGRTEAIGAVK